MECTMCQTVVAKTEELLLEHVSRVHSHSSNFLMTCIYKECKRTYRNYSSFRRHLRTAHNHHSNKQPITNEIPSASCEQDCFGSSDDNSDHEYLHTEPPSKKLRTEWILKLKETNRLTQTCTENILSDVTNLCSSIILDLTTAIQGKLTSHNATKELCQDITSILQTPSYSKPFEGLETHYKQMQCLRECFSFVVCKYNMCIMYVCVVGHT